MQQLIMCDNGRLNTVVIEEVMLQSENERELVEVSLALTVESNR
jgi:hypothetical protein